LGSRTLDLDSILRPDDLARQIANTFQDWETSRNHWLTQIQEVQRYIFATDTSTTSNSWLPWKNSTHMPKLCQVRDNLNANYMAALFPNDRPIAWEGDDEDSDAKSKRLVIESYMENKMRLGQFRTEVQKCVNDWIDYGNCFGMPEFVSEQIKDPKTNETSSGFVGPRMVRISPLDIVFNPTSASFAESPKIIRSLKTLGSIKADIENKPEMGYLSDIFDHIVNYRRALSGISQGDFAKNSEYQVSGFTNYWSYLQSGYVEILDFYGDLFDNKSGVLHKNVCISVVDRTHIIRNIPNPSWLGNAGIFHCGWRLRPDNLYAMGPLDNLVGMQYRIDHLENAKADAFDLIIHPVMKVKGFVEDFEYGPGERIYVGDDGDVEFQSPDTTMLNADTQIAMYEQKMEEMAGAPKQAMGFRTPGEKTAYEVQVLDQGANRIFLNKTSYFEEMFLEPIINAMLEMARRNMSPSDVIRVVDDQYGIVDFMKITKEDLTARGKIRPIGARHFARNANMVQNLTNLANSALGQDQAVNAHISGKKIAHLMEELLGLEEFGLVQDNIRVMEMIETQQLSQSAQQVLQEQQGAGGVPNGNPMVQASQGPQGAVPVQGPSPRK
jgi:hypothetical protein